MARHAFTQCWIHLIWATKHRAQITSRDVRRRISRFLSRQARAKEIYMLINYVNADHVHVLIDLPTKRSVADVVRLLKGSSSQEAHHRHTSFQSEYQKLVKAASQKHTYQEDTR